MEVDDNLKKSEYQFIVTIDKLRAALEKSNEHKEELSKKLEKRDEELKAKNVREGELLKKIDFQAAIIKDNEISMRGLHEENSKVKFLDAELINLRRQHSQAIELKNFRIDSLQSELRHFKKEVEELKKELDSIEVIDEHEGLTNTSENEELEEGGLINDEKFMTHEEFEEKQKNNEILKLVQGGNITVQDLKNLAEEKKVASIPKTIEDLIDEELKKNNGNIAEEILKDIKGVEFDRTGITVIAKAGKRTLKRNFMRPEFSLLK